MTTPLTEEEKTAITTLLDMALRGHVHGRLRQHFGDKLESAYHKLTGKRHEYWLDIRSSRE